MTERLRILCLHGYTGTGELFSQKLGSMRKGLKSIAEFYFLDGPFPIAKEEAVKYGGVENGRSWMQFDSSRFLR